MSAELHLKARPRLLQTGERVAGMNRKANRATRVGDAAGDRLANPPSRIRRKLEALAPIELFNGMHQTEVALLNQIEQWQTRGLIFFGD